MSPIMSSKLLTKLILFALCINLSVLYGLRNNRQKPIFQEGILDLGDESPFTARQELENLRIEVEGTLLELVMDSDITTVYPQLKDNPKISCLFSGHLNDIPGSHFLISFCTDLNGILVLESNVYKIQFHPSYGVSGENINGGDLFEHILQINNDNPILIATLLNDLHQDVGTIDPLVKELVLAKYNLPNSGDPNDIYVSDIPEEDVINYLKPDLNEDDSNALTNQNYERELHLKVAFFVEATAGLDKAKLRRILAQVNSYYSNPSLGIRVNVEVVYHETIREYGNYNVDTLLSILKRFAHDKLVRLPASKRWHSAVFLMKSTFYGRNNKGRRSGFLRGYATVGSVCGEYSVAIVRGTFDSYANTIAHELGHNIGLPHDGEGGRCRNNDYLMAPVYRGQQKWSVCSRDLLANSLHKVRCLMRKDDISNRVASYRNYRYAPNYRNAYRLEAPKVDATLYEHYYNLHPDSACKIRFGSDYRSYNQEVNEHICATLLCYNPDVSRYPDSDKGPAPNGTTCGTDKMCYESKCVPLNTYKQLTTENLKSPSKSNSVVTTSNKLPNSITASFSNTQNRCLPYCLSKEFKLNLKLSSADVNTCSNLGRCQSVPLEDVNSYRRPNKYFIDQSCKVRNMRPNSNMVCVSYVQEKSIIICVDQMCLNTLTRS